jgi:hypothetical protein
MPSMMPMFVLMNDVLVVRYSMTMAPRITPAMLFLPDTNTIRSSVISAVSLSTSGVTMPWTLATAAPPTAAKTDPRTNTSRRRWRRLMPRDSPSRSSSDMAISCRPTPDRMTRSTTAAATPSSTEQTIPDSTSVVV